jgi:D-glycero-D-manno-heptose 1,7-bisphosphate phosphatase
MNATDHTFGGRIGADDVWCEVRKPAMDVGRALFLDRDGVIIEDRNYLADPSGVALVAGIIDIMTAASARGVPTVVVTNQSGIGRGYFGWREFAAVQERMLDLLGEAGVEPAMVLACPHHREAIDPYRHPRHPMRKPEPGMLLRAAETLGIDRAASRMIGDRMDDMRAAAAAGVGGGVLIQTAPGDGKATADPAMPIERVASLDRAVPLIYQWLASTT